MHNELEFLFHRADKHLFHGFLCFIRLSQSRQRFISWFSYNVVGISFAFIYLQYGLLLIHLRLMYSLKYTYFFHLFH